jgi:hypothetical protein
VKWGPVSSLQFYNDYGYLEKLNSDFNDTAMNVTGVLVSAGSVYTYFDIVKISLSSPNWTNGLGAEHRKMGMLNMNMGITFSFFILKRKLFLSYKL